MSAQRVDPTAASLNYRGMSVSSVQQLLEDTDVPLLRGLSKRDLRRIARLAEVKRCMPGATIFRAGARRRVLHHRRRERRSEDAGRRHGGAACGDHFGELERSRETGAGGREA